MDEGAMVDGNVSSCIGDISRALTRKQTRWEGGEREVSVPTIICLCMMCAHA